MASVRMARSLTEQRGDAHDIWQEDQSMAAKKSSSSNRKGGKATKNPRKYKALRRKGMPKSRAAKITNAGKSASRKGGKKSARSRKSK